MSGGWLMIWAIGFLVFDLVWQVILPVIGFVTVFKWIVS